MTAKAGIPRTSMLRPFYYSVFIGLIAIASSLTSGCSSTSHTDVVLPNGVHCQSETSGFFLWTKNSTSCVDDKGKVIGSYSNY